MSSVPAGNPAGTIYRWGWSLAQSKGKRSGAKSSRKSSASSSKKSGKSPKGKGAKKSAKKSSSSARPRSSGKRDLVKAPNATFFAKRDADGQFKEMAEVGRSLAADRRTKSKTKVASGFGDRGDR